MPGRPSAACVLSVLLLLAPPALADTFDYLVDRFEADGNVNGPFDGVADVVDEFDDGMLAPWHVRRATATESGGFLHVQSPGLPVALPGLFPVAFEASAAGIANVLRAGNGDAVLRVVLPPQAILANDGLSFDFATVEGLALYYAGIVLTNFNSSLAYGFRPPYPVGLAATAHLERISFTNESLAAEHHAIDPDSVTGPIVLELRYDDAAGEVTPAVSVDGGTTFAAVFAPLDVEAEWGGDIVVQVAAAAYAGQCPAGLDVRYARFRGLDAGPDRQKLDLRLELPSSVIRFGLDPVRFVLADGGTGGAPVYDITLPDRATAFQQGCDARDGWFRAGYVNKSNALPPACVAGSAQGLRHVKMRWDGALDVRLKVRESSLPAVVGPLGVAVYNGTGPANECDGWVDNASCSGSGTSVRCGP
jgi:hypothetical protein